MNEKDIREVNESVYRFGLQAEGLRPHCQWCNIDGGYHCDWCPLFRELMFLSQDVDWI